MTVVAAGGPNVPLRAGADEEVDELVRVNGQWLIKTRDVAPQDEVTWLSVHPRGSTIGAALQVKLAASSVLPVAVIHGGLRKGAEGTGSHYLPGFGPRCDNGVRADFRSSPTVRARRAYRRCRCLHRRRSGPFRGP